MGEVLVTMEGIEKTFSGVHALEQAKFELRSGEVHTLVGENGAGKSTLIKVLTGIYRPNAGVISYKGVPIEIPNPKAGRLLGISMIHQELNVMPYLTIAQNIFIGREPRNLMGLGLDEQRINKQTRELLATLHITLDPRTRVSGLTVAMQQMIEIAKAISLPKNRRFSVAALKSIKSLINWSIIA